MRAIFAACLIAGGSGITETHSADPPASPYGRAGLFVIEDVQNSDASQKIRAHSYSAEIKPGKGKSFRLYADASIPGAILVAPFDRRTGMLLREFPPSLSTSTVAFENIVFPVGDDALVFEDPQEIDLYVVVITQTNPHFGRLEKMVNVIRETIGDPDSQSVVLGYQSNALRKLLDSWVRASRPAITMRRTPEPATAGIQRGNSVLWQEHAQKFPVSQKQPGALLFRIGLVDP